MGINMDGPVRYRYSSFYYFREGEYHVTRFCRDDVLLLVFDGILRFVEAGIEYEVFPGQYYIQHHDMEQTAYAPSDMAKYLYVHFRAEWAEEGKLLPHRGTFDYSVLKPWMEKLDRLCHEKEVMVEQEAVFYQILSMLYHQEKERTVADDIAEYMAGHMAEPLSLSDIAREFHFSRNYVITIFRKEYQMTPFAYMRQLRMKRAEWLLKVTSDPAGRIAADCGFRDYTVFYRTFFQEYGMGPSEWRARERAM